MKNIIKFLAALLVVIAATGCDKNSYNEEYLPGFNPDSGVTDEQVLTYTLADTDYKSIADNKDNIAKAEAAGLTKELKALGTQKYFTDKITAKDYLPTFLGAKYDSYLDNGSTVQVTYKSAIDAPAELAPISAAETYKLTADDYAVAWGGDVKADYFTPAKPAATYLPAILKKAVAGAEAGDYVVASYEYSDQEPSTGEGPEEVITKIGEVKFAGDYTVEGWVAATCARGYILADASGSILVYLNAVPNVTLGDKLKVSGAASEFNGCMQFGNSAVVTFQDKTPEFAFPASPEQMTGTQMDSYLTAPTIKYVSYTGKLSISGNYYNVTIDGATAATGSLYFPNPQQIDASLNGKKIVVTGYLSSVSKSNSVPKFANTIITSIHEVNSSAAYTPVGIVATAKPGAYTVKGTVAATYARGFLVNDGTGSILVYLNKAHDYLVGDVVTVSGTTSAYSGLNQFPAAATVTKLNTEAGKFTYPAAVMMDGPAKEDYLKVQTAKYVKYIGTLSISSDNKYYNVLFDDSATAQGSISYPNTGLVDPALNGKSVEVTGYLIGTSSGKFLNTMATAVKEATPAAVAAARAAVTKNKLALYKFSGLIWEATTNSAIIVNPEDYTQMGFSSANFSSSLNPNNYLPAFLKLKFPYAQPDETRYVAYHFYTGSATELHAVQYALGSEWTKTLNTVDEVGPFEKMKGKWTFNPSMTITLNPDKSPFSKSYYQAGIDYVIANKDVLYRTNNSTGAVSTDSEFYSGCASGYTNLNWRINTLPVYYWKAVEGEEATKQYIYEKGADGAAIRACEEAFYKEAEKRFGEVMSAGLATMHPDAAPIEGIDIIYTVKMMLYTSQIGSSTGKVTHAFEFKLVGKGKFEYVKMYALNPEFELIQDKFYQ